MKQREEFQQSQILTQKHRNQNIRLTLLDCDKLIYIILSWNLIYIRYIFYRTQKKRILFYLINTLTNDTLLFTGIVDNCVNRSVKSKSDCSLYCQQILAGCHQLIYADNKLQGDPIELLFFQQNNQWSYQTQQKYAQNRDLGLQLYQKQVFSFKSDLKRMSTVVQVDQKSQRHYRLLVKGAPEALQQLFQEVPDEYEYCYQHYSNLGYRVLCLADREIEEFENQEREELEQNLVFRGFLICESPLKTDTQQWIKKFKLSYFQPIIITGDNLLTAIAVGKQLQLHDKVKYLEI